MSAAVSPDLVPVNASVITDSGSLLWPSPSEWPASCSATVYRSLMPAWFVGLIPSWPVVLRTISPEDVPMSQSKPLPMPRVPADMGVPPTRMSPNRESPWMVPAVPNAAPLSRTRPTFTLATDAQVWTARRTSRFQAAELEPVPRAARSDESAEPICVPSRAKLTVRFVGSSHEPVGTVRSSSWVTWSRLRRTGMGPLMTGGIRRRCGRGRLPGVWYLPSVTGSRSRTRRKRTIFVRVTVLCDPHRNSISAGLQLSASVSNGPSGPPRQSVGTCRSPRRDAEQPLKLRRLADRVEVRVGPQVFPAVTDTQCRGDQLDGTEPVRRLLL